MEGLILNFKFRYIFYNLHIEQVKLSIPTIDKQYFYYLSIQLIMYKKQMILNKIELVWRMRSKWRIRMNETAAKYFSLHTFNPKDNYIVYFLAIYLNKTTYMNKMTYSKYLRWQLNIFLSANFIQNTITSTSCYLKNDWLSHFIQSNVFEWIKRQLVKIFPDDGGGIEKRKYSGI